MDVAQHQAGRDCCIGFYAEKCCNETILPGNPNDRETEEWKSWNAGWNSFFPECSMQCKLEKQKDMFDS